MKKNTVEITIDILLLALYIIYIYYRNLIVNDFISAFLIGLGLRYISETIKEIIYNDSE